MDLNHDGKVSPDEFVEVVQKVMEELSELSRQKGMKAMQAAAEGVACKAEAEVVRKEAEARAKAEAELHAHNKAEMRLQAQAAEDAKAQAEALAQANECTNLLQCKLDELDAVGGGGSWRLVHARRVRFTFCYRRVFRLETTPKTRPT